MRSIWTWIWRFPLLCWCWTLNSPHSILHWILYYQYFLVFQYFDCLMGYIPYKSPTFLSSFSLIIAIKNPFMHSFPMTRVFLSLWLYTSLGPLPLSYINHVVIETTHVTGYFVKLFNNTTLERFENTTSECLKPAERMLYVLWIIQKVFVIKSHSSESRSSYAAASPM